MENKLSAIERVRCGAFEENAWLISPEGDEGCILVDPGDDLPALSRAVARTGRPLRAILLTHAHFDHMLAAKPLSEEFGAPVYCHPLDAPLLSDPEKNGAFLAGGATALPCPAELATLPYPEPLSLCGLKFSALHTPGHTPGGVSLYVPEQGALFSGDTLFAQGFGRMDLYGGSPSAMRGSLRLLFNLPPKTRLYPGHGEQSTLGRAREAYR